MSYSKNNKGFWMPPDPLKTMGQFIPGRDAGKPAIWKPTFIIDRNDPATIEAFVNNEAGVDFSRLLITGTLGTEATLINFQVNGDYDFLKNRGVKSIVGDPDAPNLQSITANNSYGFFGPGGTEILKGSEYFIKNISLYIWFWKYAYGFRKFYNLDNCATFNYDAYAGFSDCDLVNNCHSNANGTTVGNNRGFLRCTNVTNCIATNKYGAYKYPESFADDGTIPASNNANNR